MTAKQLPDKPKATHCGFSLYPEHNRMLESLQQHLNATRSRVLQHLIEQEYKKLTRSEQNA
jgi:hypothetical protein